MSATKCLSVCCAALSIALLVRATPVGAFGTEIVPSGNGEGAARSAKAGDQGPVPHLGDSGAGASPYVVKSPSRDSTADKGQSGDTVRGSTFDPEETRFVFGPFNHFGYGSANQ